MAKKGNRSIRVCGKSGLHAIATVFKDEEL